MQPYTTSEDAMSDSLSLTHSSEVVVGYTTGGIATPSSEEYFSQFRSDSAQLYPSFDFSETILGNSQDRNIGIY